MTLINNLKIVNATMDDIDGIRNLMKQLCKTLGKTFNEERFYRGLLKRLNDKIQKNGYFLAKDGEKVVGMIFAEISEVINMKNTKELEGFLKTVIVDEAYRGLKLGEKLIERAIEYFKEKNIKIIRTNVHEKAEIALKLYTKFGFVNEFELEPFNRYILRL
ncbi:MAG: GNAT family N-acetyltransferase [Candidatus Helarchaeota archaeon]